MNFLLLTLLFFFFFNNINSVEFFPKLSQNYIELLKDDEYYDITIEVGEDPNVKIFRAHMNILCYRSPYLRQIITYNNIKLSSIPPPGIFPYIYGIFSLNEQKNKKDDDSLSHIKLPNISPEIFPIILEYIYGGILSLNEQETFNILNFLIAADVLGLQELVDYLQKYLIENKFKWMEENFEFTQRVSSQYNNLLELQQFCTDFIIKSPEKVLKSFNFTSLPEKVLISLIKRDDLQMKEVEIWEHVLKWGLAKNPILTQNPNTWSDDDFKMMENTLQNCLPLIRFFCLSSEEFTKKVRPYRKLLKRQLYEDLLNSYLDPKSVSTENILLPRNIKIDEIIDSKIVNFNIISIISRWIDKIVIDNKFNKFDGFRELYLPYKFQLLLRGSRDGFTPKRFHELCDNKPKTVTFIKVKGTEEILGGYNPIIWKSSLYGKTKDSFIFSFKNKNDFKDVIINNVKNENYALTYGSTRGPGFGFDLVMLASDEYTDYDKSYCGKDCYEKAIRDTREFSIEDYEVFQIIKR